MLAWLSRALDATPGQEKVLLSVWERLEAARVKAHTDLGKAAAAMARELRAERLDRDALQQQISNAHGELVHVEEAILDSLAELHEALDPRQRRILADLFERLSEARPPRGERAGFCGCA